VPTLRDGAPLRIGIEEVGITVSIDRSGFDLVLHLADVAIPSLLGSHMINQMDAVRSKK
jgi:hypothetical protein